jgi:ribulose 1,5-bisphosphate carboxylase large subunit-like protein
LPVSVTYRGVTFDSEAPAVTIDKMRRDASWGTYVEHLQAAETAAGLGAVIRWRELEPELVDVDDAWPPTQFILRFPDDNFDIDAEGIDHVLGTAAGDIALNREIQSLEVDDIVFEGDRYEQALPGPNVGIDGLYDNLLSGTLQGIQRPVLAFSIKPRRGLSVEDLTALYSEAAKGGADVVEDDERLIDPPNCRFVDRVQRLSDLQVENGTLYSPNVTGDMERTLKRLDLCVELGIRIVKIDVMVSGFEVLRRVALEIRSRDLPLAVTVYPDAYGAFRRLSRRFILKLARICGADVVYAGSPIWARYEAPAEALPRDAIEPIYLRHRLLARPLPELPLVRSTLGTITNDQHPSRAELLTALFRRHKQHFRYGFFVGGGIAAFPASISEGVETWKRCLEHAATTDLDDYQAFDFGAHDEGLASIGWEQMDVRSALQ